MCAQPTDVVKVRMQAQVGGPRYSGSIDAYKTIARTEGVKGLWKGRLLLLDESRDCGKVGCPYSMGRFVCPHRDCRCNSTNV